MYVLFSKETELCVLFPQKALSAPIKISSEYISKFQKVRHKALKNFFVSEIFQFRKITATCNLQELPCNLMRPNYIVKVNIIYILLCGSGEDPFEAVMCAVGAASQISYCLSKSFVSYTKHHLNLNRNVST